MSAAVHQRHNQGPHCNKERDPAQRLIDLIRYETGINCEVFVNSKSVSIRAKNYSEYLLARSTIRSRVSLDIVWDGDADQTLNPVPKMTE